MGLQSPREARLTTTRVVSRKSHPFWPIVARLTPKRDDRIRRASPNCVGFLESLFERITSGEGGMDEERAFAPPQACPVRARPLNIRGGVHFSSEQRQISATGQMQGIRRFRLLVASLLTLAATFMTNACDAGPDIVDHAFEFDAIQDSPGIKILDHRYGDTKAPGARNPDYLLKEGRALQRTATSGAMRRPESLYVKWLVLADNTIHEDTVDLRKRLPRRLEGWKVYFLVRGAQLYVYLVSQEPRAPNTPPNGPSKYHDRKVETIYPNEKH